MTTKDIHILAHHSQLKHWPTNPRKTYRPESVAGMAASQLERAERGQPALIHAIVVTPGPGISLESIELHHTPKRSKHAAVQTFYIVAGHRRHAGNASLGAKAPLLNCVVRYYATEADMKADMRTENGQREDLTPLEWGHHFRDEIDAGVPLHTLIKQSHKSPEYVKYCMSLLDMTPETQRIFDSGDLPIGAVKHLSEIEDPKRQEKLARRLRGGTIAQVSKAVTLDMAIAVERHRKRGLLKPRRPSTDNLPATLPINAAKIRAAAAHQCSICNMSKNLRVSEPAWHIALDAAGQVCDNCDLKEIRRGCNGCPLAEMMSSLARRHGVTAATASSPAGIRLVPAHTAAQSTGAPA